MDEVIDTVDEASTDLETSVEDKPKSTVSIPDLFNNYTTAFLDETISLFTHLNLFLDKIQSIVSDKKKLMEFAKDYKFILGLEEQARTGTLNMGALEEVLQEKLAQFKKDNPEFARVLEQELMRLFMNIGVSSTVQSKLLKEISKLINDPDRLMETVEVPNEFIEMFKQKNVIPKSRSRIDVASAYAELLEEEKVKSNIRNILSLVRRHLGEIITITYDIPDINDWNIHVHDDITFFTQRVEGYFKGDILKDREGKDIQGINSFRDEELRRETFGSRDIRELQRIAAFTHRVTEQMDYILRLISFLKRDIDPRTGQWVRNEATAEFYNHLDRFAETFRTEFADNPFASYLLKNKANIGERPFRWIAILNGMKERLEELMRRKNFVIDNAKNFLSITFSRRVNELKAMIVRLSTKANQINLNESGIKNLNSEVMKGIKRVKRHVKKLWKNRRKRFIKAYDRVKYMNTDLAPYLDELMGMYDIELEAGQLATSGKGITQFSDHTAQVVDRIGIPTADNIGYVLMLDFDFARLSELHIGFDEAVQKIKQKDTSLRQFDISSMKKIALNLASSYMNIIQWVRNRIEVNTEQVRTEINSFVIKHSDLQTSR